jgi:hypothetical protein
VKPFIPAWLDDFGLPCAEFRVCADLWRRADAKGQCYPSGANIMKVCRISENTLWKALKNLEARGLLQRRNTQRANLYQMIVPGFATAKGGATENLLPSDLREQLPQTEGEQLPQSERQLLPQKRRHKGYPSEGTPNEGTPHEGEKRPRARFVAPSLEEWLAEAERLHSDWPKADAESAWNHYESVGWTKGKSPIKRWQSCINTCFRMWQERNGKENGQLSESQLAMLYREETKRAASWAKPTFEEWKAARENEQTRERSLFEVTADGPPGWETLLAEWHPDSEYAPGGKQHPTDWVGLPMGMQAQLRRDAKVKWQHMRRV